MAGKVVFLSAVGFLAMNGISASKCVRLESEIKSCDMIDYSVHHNLDIDRARAQAEELIPRHLDALKNSKKSKKERKSRSSKMSGEFCEQLVRATICNILFPPCEGDGSERYRKPCLGFDIALHIGCGIQLAFGDMTFAYPPDCYELPIVPRPNEMEFVDSEMIGSLQDSSGRGGIRSAGRGADLLKLGILLQDNGETEHAAHMLLSALRYVPQDPEAHTRQIPLS